MACCRPLILLLSWKQTFLAVCKGNEEEEEEEDEGCTDFQDVDCVLSCLMAAAHRAAYLEEGVCDRGYVVLSSVFFFWCFLLLQWTTPSRTDLQPWGQRGNHLTMRQENRVKSKVNHSDFMCYTLFSCQVWTNVFMMSFVGQFLPFMHHDGVWLTLVPKSS